MTEYIEREALLQAILDLPAKMDEQGYGWLGRRGVWQIAMDFPAADVRPVVLCCDCKHFQVNVSPSGYLPQGVPEWECRHWCRPTGQTDFCSYGEKMEES